MTAQTSPIVPNTAPRTICVVSPVLLDPVPLPEEGDVELAGGATTVSEGQKVMV